MNRRYQIKYMEESYRKLLRNISLTSVVEGKALYEVVFGNDHTSKSINGNNIVIVGGELFNKGAQAMTFTTVDHIKRRYPEKDIYLLSGQGFVRPKKEKEQYNFGILPWGPEIIHDIFIPDKNAMNTDRYPENFREKIKDTLSDCALMIDINGYALSSQIGFRISLSYLMNISIAREYDIPMFIFPQSIGPFNFSRIKEMALHPLMKAYLTYPEVICPREEEGINALRAYTSTNVQQEYDIVLQGKEYQIDNIYASKSPIIERKIDSKAVGIVPNSKVFERTSPEKLYKLYETAIQTLLSEGYNVYVFRHSVEDLNHCQQIKQRFANNSKVILLEEEMNAIELEQIIGQLDFLIGSRYHSLIHAYKNHVPVIAIGWATKYQELLARFGQYQYFFEGRSDIDCSKFNRKIRSMIKKRDKESKTIRNKVNEIHGQDLFSRLFP